MRMSLMMPSLAILMSAVALQMAAAETMNCTVSQNTVWVNHEGAEFPREMIVMYEAASGAGECADICRAYSADNIEPNVELFNSIGFQCLFEREKILSETLK